MFKSMLIKEFLLVSRDKHALAALFIMPCVFILIMSLALKDVFNEQKSMLSLAIIDAGNNSSSEQLISELQDNSVIESQLLARDNSDNMTQIGTQFLLKIPAEYGDNSDVVLQAMIASDVTQNVLLLFKAQISQIVMQQKLAELNKQQIAIAKKMGASEPAAITFSQDDIINVQYANLAENQKPTSTQQSVPSWIVFGLFFVIIPMSTIFISERKQNTLMRLSAMNITIPALFAGKIIPYLVINQIQVWLMIAVGMFVVPHFGADALTIGGSLPALLILSFSLSLAAIGLSILIATSVDSIEQATTIGGIINILLGAIGGIMVPKFVMPEFMQELANISPMSWGLEGYLELFLRQGNLADVQNEVFALSGFGLSALLFATVIFKIKLRKVA
jgi:ABC-2 type transport system permease protein